MKKILFVLLNFVAVTAVAQNPNLINYQGAARDAAGEVMVNANLSIRFEFLQGAGTPATVFTETQTIITNSLGVFSTQIGKNTSGGLSAINFDAGNLQLRVGLDVSGGSSFVTVGTQSLVSVPYSMYAASVPATYTNNVLTIGNTSFTLAGPSAVYTGGNGISIISNTVINTSPDQTVSIDPGNSNVSVTGAYPNFSVSSTPSLSLLAPGTLSISNGNTVNIDPTVSYSNGILTVGGITNTVAVSPSLGITGNVLSVGAANNTITIPTGTFITTVITPSGALTSNLSGNNFTLNVPPTNITVSNLPGAPSITTVSINNFSVNIPSQVNQSLSLLPANSVSITNGGSVTLTQTLGLSGNILNVGPVTNSIVLPSATSQSISLSAANTVSLSNGGTVAIAPSLSVINNTLTVGPNTNTIALVTPNIVGGGAAIVGTTSVNNYSVSVLPTNITVSNLPGAPSISTISINNFSVNIPSQVSQSISLSPAPNTLSLTNGGTVAIAPSLGLAGNVLTVGPATNTLLVPGATNQTLSLLSANSVSLSNGGTVAIAPTLGVANNVLTVGPTTNTIALVTPNIVGGGAAIVGTTSVNNYSVSVLPSNITLSNLPGVASISTISTNNFSLNIPSQVSQSISLSPAPNTLSLTNGGTVAIAPSLGLAGNVLTVGPATNTLLVPGATNQTLSLLSANSVSLTNGGTVAIAPTLGVANNVLTVGPATNTIALVTPNIVGGGAAVVGTTSTNNYSVSVLPSNITLSNLPGVASISTISTNNFSLNIPSQVNQSISLSPAPNTLSLTNGGTVAIAPGLSVLNNVLTVGPATNTVALTTPNIVGGGAVSVGTISANNYSVSVPSTQLQQGANVNISGAFPNFTIASVPTLAISGSTISISNGNSVNLPFASLTGAGVAAVTGATNFTINVPPSNIAITNTSTAAGISTISANNFNINVPSPNIAVSNLAGAASVSTISTNNYSINVPPPSITAAGLSTVANTGNSFTVGVPMWSYTNTTGVISSGVNTLNIAPLLSITGGTLTSGPASNSVPITGLLNSGTTNYVPKWNGATALASTSQIFDDGTNVGIGTTSPAQKLDITGYLRVAAGAGSANEGWILATPSPGYSSLIAGGRATTEARISQPNNAPLTFQTNNVERMRIDGSGNVGINNLAPTVQLDLIGLSKFTNTTLVTGYVIDAQNNTPSSGQSSGVLSLINTGLRSIGNNAATIQNLTTKSSGNNSTKTGLEILSTGVWNSGTNQGMYNRGLFVNVSGGGDGNFPAILMGGNVGVNSSVPDATLNVDGTFDVGTGNAISGAYGVAMGYNNTISGIGSAAIGTSLNVSGNRSIAFGDQVTITGLGSVGFGDWQGGSAFNLVCSAQNQFSARYNGGYRFFADDNLTPVNAVYITGTTTTGGNVGLGIATPSQKFVVGDGTNEKLTISAFTGDVRLNDPMASISFPDIVSTSNGMINMFNVGTTNPDRMVIQHSPSYPGWGLQYSDLTDKFNFISNSLPVLTADLSNRRVGIGTTTPGYPLHIVNSLNTDGAHIDNNTTAGGIGLQSNLTTAAVSAGTRYGLLTYSWYGLGLNYGVYAYAYGGTNAYGVYGSASGGSSTNYAVYANGAIAGVGALVNVSDRKFKKDIAPLKGALDKLMLLEPKTYNMRTDEFADMNFSTKPQFGLIAQEVEEVFPELVEKGISPPPVDKDTHEQKGEGTEFLGMNYIGLTPIMIQAIKEQQAQIEELKKQLAEQKQLLEQLLKK